MNPERYEYIMETLFKLGVMDVFMTPIVMKKSRPGVVLSVLCKESLEKEVSKILLTETTTLGVRKHYVSRDMLKRNFISLDTKYGEVKVKEAYLGENKIKFKPEYEDCKKAAQSSGVTLNEVYNEVYREIYNVK